MENEQKLTKAQKRELRKQEWQQKVEADKKQDQFKKIAMWVGAALVVILGIAGLAWMVNSTPSATSETVSIAPVSDKDITNSVKDAKITLFEYADFQCPACASYQPIIKQILTEYEGKILFVYRNFPLTNVHKNAVISAQAGVAAHKQGRFFEMAEILYDRQKDWETVSDPTSLFIDYAKELKFDINKFKNDLNSDDTKNFIKDSEKLAISEGMNSTPTFVLNGIKIRGANTLDDFKKLIDNELNKK
ncbi:MAG: hypothetical protein A2171_02580 [Candidatus Levybacteria bacterium RBG_13_35_9]|nr:MAG: hypothetical protein A2171_02580 [Candidatus Levybacteria bacterium RBG_13_35_9]